LWLTCHLTQTHVSLLCRGLCVIDRYFQHSLM